jgi:hypothetical protein
LEALLKRVDGLEAKLREKGEDDVSLASSNLPGAGKGGASENGSQVTEVGESTTKRATVDARASPGDTASLSPQTPIARFVLQSLFYPGLILTHSPVICPPLQPKPRSCSIHILPGFMGNHTISSMNPLSDKDFNSTSSLDFSPFPF